MEAGLQATTKTSSERERESGFGFAQVPIPYLCSPLFHTFLQQVWLLVLQRDLKLRFSVLALLFGGNQFALPFSRKGSSCLFPI